MQQPSVTGIMLTADRHKYADRAVAVFLAQSYRNKRLLILDNGTQPYPWPANAPGVSVVRTTLANKTIGALRNLANGIARDADILAHFDDDDYSHPLRLAWQVQKLKTQAGGNEYEGYPKHTLDAVGYNTMLFWRKSDQTAWLFQHATPGYCVGTSLMYWRKTWEAHPFPEKNCGEDLEWLRDSVGYGNAASVEGFFKDEPAMVAEIHESNSTKQTIPGDSWKRMPGWDEKLKVHMAI